MVAEKPKMHFYVDVVSGCNLRCPSCPSGNSQRGDNAKGMMSPDTLHRILAKAAKECKITGVGLFNWSEPLLHPEIDDMVRVVRSCGIKCSISTNLNVPKNVLKKLIAAGPDILRVSLSGFRKETYERTHRGGDLGLLRDNLDFLLKEKTGICPSTRISVAFHRYRSNVADEAVIAEYCRENEVLLQTVDALFLPLEKVMAICGILPLSEITEEDERLVGDLIMPPKKAVAEMRGKAISRCRLLDEQITLNCRGDALLCCAVYDESKFVIGNYLDDALDEIQRKRKSSAVCKLCMANGLPSYFTYDVPGMDAFVRRDISGCQVRGKG